MPTKRSREVLRYKVRGRWWRCYLCPDSHIYLRPDKQSRKGYFGRAVHEHRTIHVNADDSPDILLAAIHEALHSAIAVAKTDAALADKEECLVRLIAPVMASFFRAMRGTELEAA